MGTIAALAFVKIDGRPFINVVLSAVSFYWKPQMYLWKSEQKHINKENSPTIGNSIQNIAEGFSLHKSWEGVQTGVKISNVELTQHYQIFHKQTGERRAAKRVDYR